MRRALVWLVWLLVSPTMLWGASLQDVNRAVGQLAQRLVDELEVTPVEIQVRFLNQEGTAYASEASEDFLQRLATVLSQHTEDVHKVQPYAPRFISRAGAPFGHVEPVQPNKKEATLVYLEGHYRLIADRVMVAMRLRDDQHHSVSHAEVSLQSTALAHSWKPHHEDRFQKIASAFNRPTLPEKKTDLSSPASNHETSSFPLGVRFNKANGATFLGKEELRVYVRPEKSAYVQVLYIDAAGHPTLLYPKHPEDHQKRLLGGVFHDLFIHHRWQITCQKICGPELVVVRASTQPFPEHSRNLRSHNAKALVTAFRAVEPLAETAERQIHITTLPRP